MTFNLDPETKSTLRAWAESVPTVIRMRIGGRPDLGGLVEITIQALFGLDPPEGLAPETNPARWNRQLAGILGRPVNVRVWEETEPARGNLQVAEEIYLSLPRLRVLMAVRRRKG